MGPAVTLAVLCDQLYPSGDEMDDEEKQIRERLRLLVINFLLEDGRESILRQPPIETDALLDGIRMVSGF